MKNLLSLLLFNALSVSLLAQTVHLSGNVLDEEGKPLIGNALALDSSGQMISGTFFEKGEFHLDVKTSITFRLKITSLGYSEWEQSIPIEPAEQNLGNIHLKTDSLLLGEATVTGQKMIFEKSMDGIKLNVSGTLLSKSVSATEILTKSPGVTFAAGKYSVIGRGEALVIVNGKESTSESIRSLPPQEIESVEIITNPDARYDAKGKTVIIITLKKGFQEGLFVTLSENISGSSLKKEEEEFYFFHNPSLTLSYRKNRLNLNSYYSNEGGWVGSMNDFSRLNHTASGDYYSPGIYRENVQSKSIHQYRLGMSYDPNPKNSWSFQYDGFSHYFLLDVNQKSEYFSPSDYTHLDMKNDASTRLQNHTGNINFTRKIDTLGSTFFTGVQYNHFENKLNDNITEQKFDSAVLPSVFHRKNLGENQIDLFNFQSDYVKKLSNGSFETGLKYSDITNQGSLRFFSKTENEIDFTENEAIANQTIYRENLAAAYFTMKKNISRVNFSAGLRTEYSNTNGYSKKYDQTFIDSSYLQFFPSAKIYFPEWKKVTTQITYSRKINRPLFQDLDPFYWYLDSLTRISGNPLLTPESLHQTEIKFSFGSFSLKAAYTTSQNTIWFVTRPLPENEGGILYHKENIGNRSLFTLGTEISLEKNSYSSYTTVLLNASRFHHLNVGINIGKVQPQIYIYTYQAIRFLQRFNFEITGEYYGKSADGITLRNPYYYVTGGLSGHFLEEKLQVQITYNDFLRTARLKGIQTIGSISNQYDQRVNSSYIRISVTYSFGTLRNSTYKNASINDSEFNRIKK